jgi:hypothetical protein
MDWWVHGIGADGALQQLVDAGGRCDRRGTHNVNPINVVAIARLGGHELGVVVRMWMKTMVLLLLLLLLVVVDLILVQIRD